MIHFITSNPHNSGVKNSYYSISKPYINYLTNPQSLTFRQFHFPVFVIAAIDGKMFRGNAFGGNDLDRHFSVFFQAGEFVALAIIQIIGHFLGHGNATLW